MAVATRVRASQNEPDLGETHDDRSDAEESLGSRLDQLISRTQALEISVAKQNSKMEKHFAEMFESIHMLSRSGPSNHADVCNQFRSSQASATSSLDLKVGKQSGILNTYVGVTRLEKLDFPRFSSDKVQEWLILVEQFFEIDQTPDELKIGLVSIHFDDIAAAWHQSIAQSGLWKHIMHDWETYKLLLLGKYNKHVDDSIAQLKQLQETEGIEEYHARFGLINTTVDIDEDYLVSVYLAGLRTDTRENVQIFQPQTVNQCFLVGRLYEQAHPLKRESEMKAEEDKEWVKSEAMTSCELLPLKGKDSRPQLALRSESKVGKTDSSSQNGSELCTKKEGEVKGWIHEQANNHSTDSLLQPSLVPHRCLLLKQQVSISHLEFSHRTPIGSLDVHEDLSAIMRSQFEFECAASMVLQVFHSMPLRTKLLQNLRKQRLSKTWWFKFKELDVMLDDVQHVLLAFLQRSAINKRYEIGEHDEMLKVSMTVSVRCMLGLKCGRTMGDTGHGEKYVYDRIIMVKKQLSHNSLVIHEVMRNKKIKSSKFKHRVASRGLQSGFESWFWKLVIYKLKGKAKTFA
ncbi:Retrotransposon gag domain [Arabidopsis thaliana x Arabidopsis arenosa]|uniref:Retrotransposon gag domain n=1 Tax=Arabidopsis thaliana x Arabidopsis arenosa TaxID=1240361 RepID=A0A8T1XHL6_9BRAS|nr:Retrotransposon gag domain [Arabidopsis thaliana x Arabidopsis arenosa]